MHKLTVRHTAHRGDVQIRFLRNILENHRPKCGFITGHEEFLLVAHNGFHGAEQGMLPLPDGIDEPFGGIDLLLDEKHGLFLALVLLAAPFISPKHLPVALADPQIGRISAVQGQFKLTGIVVQEEIRYHVAFGLIQFPKVGPRLGRKFDDLADGGFQAVLVYIEAPLDLLVMLLGEFIEIMMEDLDGYSGGFIIIHRFFAVQLQ